MKILMMIMMINKIFYLNFKKMKLFNNYYKFIK